MEVDRSFGKLQMIYDAIIIGGGISGLTAAYTLKKKGKSVLLLEKGDSVGGNIRTVRDGDYLLELGPNTLRNEYLELERLIIELGLQEEVIAPSDAAKKSYIMYGGSLHALPSSPMSAMSSSLLSFTSKLGLLREPFVKMKSLEDESVASFFDRRLGTHVVDRLVAPMVAGIFAGDVNRLSIRSAFPKLKSFEERHGSLIRGMMQARKNKVKRETVLPKVFSFKQGIGALTNAMQSNLAGCLKTVVSCKKITRSGLLYTIETEEDSYQARSTILCTPAHISSTITSEIDEALSKKLLQIEYPPVIVLHLAFKLNDIKHPLDGFGFLIPPSEKRDILGCVFTSGMFNDRAPKDEAIVTVLMGGATRREMIDKSDEELRVIGESEVRTALGISSSSTYSRITRWQKAIPQYNIGHQKIMDEIDRVEKENTGLYFLANYRGGISVGSCIKNAFELASRLS